MSSEDNSNSCDSCIVDLIDVTQSLPSELHLTGGESQGSSVTYSDGEIPSLNASLSAETIYNLSLDGKDDKDCNVKYYPAISSCVTPFIYNGTSINYNTSNGVNPRAPIIFGSKTNDFAVKGYHKTRLSFDPSNGTLVAGTDINNKWLNNAKNCAIFGVGNFSESANSLISGLNNNIKINSSSVKKYNKTNPSGSAIIGGKNNKIVQDTEHQSNFIASSERVNLKNCNNVSVIGVKNASYENVTDTLIVENLRVRNEVHGKNAYFDNIYAKNIGSDNDNSVYLYSKHGNTGTVDICDGNTCHSNEYIVPNNINIIYVHAANGDVTIVLPSDVNPNKQFVIKDVSLEFGKVSSYDIHIKVSSKVKIEQYSHGSIIAKLGGKYTIKTSGGSVSLRYFHPSIPGFTPTWVIENQFIGNPRTYPDQGFTMTHSGEIIRQNIFKRGQRK